MPHRADQIRHADKVCAACGRLFSWRKKWERDWDRVKYCSMACKRWKPTALDLTLERTILGLLASSAGGVAISLEEVVKAAREATDRAVVTGEADPDRAALDGGAARVHPWGHTHVLARDAGDSRSSSLARMAPRPGLGDAREFTSPTLAAARKAAQRLAGRGLIAQTGKGLVLGL